MDTVFPFGLPFPTAFYLTLFVLTLVVHVLFMNYVLAGSAWLAWSVLAGRAPLGNRSVDTVTREVATSESILADWIPSMLSGAITAGVAPLLFVQILYQREFYSANLLLFSRWMSILPVLVIGFYSLYILRSKWLVRRAFFVRTFVGLLPFLCIAFVAYSWTENHLLSVAHPDAWRAFYQMDQQIYFEPQIIPRLAVWGLGAIPTLCVWLSWQLRYRWQHRLPVDERAMAQLPRVALTGLLASFLGAVAYYLSAPDRGIVFFGPMARWYLVLAMVGVIGQAAGWVMILRESRREAGGRFGDKSLILVTAGLVATIVGMSVCREAIRLVSLGESRVAELFQKHADALKVEGFGLFVTFAIINSVLIAGCFGLVRNNYKPHDSHGKRS